MRRLGLVSDWVRMSRTASLSMGQRGQVRLGVWVLACCVGACLLCAGFTAQLERGDFPCALRAFIFAPALPPSRVRPVDQGPSLRVRQLREASWASCCFFTHQAAGGSWTWTWTETRNQDQDQDKAQAERTTCQIPNPIFALACSSICSSVKQAVS